MSRPRSLKYSGGTNIAIKVPPHQWEDTVRFYRDTLGLEVEQEQQDSVTFHFGENRLWIDRIEAMSQAEVWLELNVNDVDAAAQHLEEAAVVRRDEIEDLPDDFNGFWITSPASIIHLVTDEE